MYHWWIFVHVLAVFLFLLTHGVSIGIAFMVRRETDPARLRPLLELSGYSVGALHLGMLLVFATGIVLGFLADRWSEAWLWVSLALFVAMWFAMALWGTRGQDRLRAAIGLRPFYAKKGAPTPTPGAPELVASLARSPRPIVLTILGLVALVAFLYLMMFQPG